jgi:hypothetical protein
VVDLPGQLDPAPSGADIQPVAKADATFDGRQSFPSDTGWEVDLTRAERPTNDPSAGDQVTTFTASGNGVAGVDMDTGLVSIETTSPGDPQTGSIEATAETTLPWTGDPPNEISESATRDYEANPDYFFAAIGWPSRADPFYEDVPGQTLVLAAVSDSGDSALIDDVCLDEADKIAQALEDSINTALSTNGDTLPEEAPGYTPSVKAAHDPDWHSATGYLVWSETLVESSFDQSVDVSSVEIDTFTTLVDEGVIDIADLDEFSNWGELEQQDIAPALGFAGGPGPAYNTVNAETIVNEPDDLVGHVDYDRYSPRADPLDQVIAIPNNEFLGDNELTCNGLELGRCLKLLGCECPDTTTDLHEDDVNVILFYDSEYSAVFDPIPVGRQSGLVEETDRPGAPNAVEGLLTCLVHADFLPRWRSCGEGGEFVDGPRVEQNVPLAYYDLSLWELLVSQYGDALDQEQGPLPFYEGFDIVEVKDSIIDEKLVEEWEEEYSDALCQSIPDTQIRPAGGVERGLLPEDTVVHNVYGDRFDGLTVRNLGTVDLANVNEHTLSIGNADERDWIHGGQLIGIEGASRDPTWPENRPDLVTFIGQTLLDCSEYNLGLGNPDVENPYFELDDEWLFTDDQEEEIWFGTNSETTCEVPVEDNVELDVVASLSNDVDSDASAEYEIPPLYDHDSDGVYDAVRPTADDTAGEDIIGATFQDRGIFFESHDDMGGLPSGSTSGGFPCDTYACDNGSVTGSGLVQAITDWRNGNISSSELTTIIQSWRSS